jgi:hypothetical protein
MEDVQKDLDMLREQINLLTDVDLRVINQINSQNKQYLKAFCKLQALVNNVRLFTDEEAEGEDTAPYLYMRCSELSEVVRKIANILRNIV